MYICLILALYVYAIINHVIYRTIDETDDFPLPSIQNNARTAAECLPDLSLSREDLAIARAPYADKP